MQHVQLKRVQLDCVAEVLCISIARCTQFLVCHPNQKQKMILDYQIENKSFLFCVGFLDALYLLSIQLTFNKLLSSMLKV